jgi:hypothetical protein
MTEEQTQDQATVEQIPQEQQPIALTVNDLTLTANVIDLAVQRGAFKAAEATTVGNVFNKLVAIIQAINPPKPEGEGETTEASTEETSEE